MEYVKKQKHTVVLAYLDGTSLLHSSPFTLTGFALLVGENDNLAPSLFFDEKIEEFNDLLLGG